MYTSHIAHPIAYRQSKKVVTAVYNG